MREAITKGKRVSRDHQTCGQRCCVRVCFGEKGREGGGGVGREEGKKKVEGRSGWGGREGIRGWREGRIRGWREGVGGEEGEVDGGSGWGGREGGEEGVEGRKGWGWREGVGLEE